MIFHLSLNEMVVSDQTG